MSYYFYKSLQEFSKDHHQALLLCWKIKVGLSKKVEVEKVFALGSQTSSGGIFRAFTPSYEKISS